jgi:hypothetical protein
VASGTADQTHRRRGIRAIGRDIAGANDVGRGNFQARRRIKEGLRCLEVAVRATENQQRAVHLDEVD